MPAKILIYVAGPLHSSGIELENCKQAIMRAELLLERGFAVFVPHLNAFWNFMSPHPPADWLENDLVILARCDAVFRLPGESKGADAEEAYATECGIPVFRDLESLVGWWARGPKRS